MDSPSHAWSLFCGLRCWASGEVGGGPTPPHSLSRMGQMCLCHQGNLLEGAIWTAQPRHEGEPGFSTVG